jgi:hypothetical protein
MWTVTNRNKEKEKKKGKRGARDTSPLSCMCSQPNRPLPIHAKCHAMPCHGPRAPALETIPFVPSAASELPRPVSGRPLERRRRRASIFCQNEATRLQGSTYNCSNHQARHCLRVFDLVCAGRTVGSHGRQILRWRQLPINPPPARTCRGERTFLTRPYLHLGVPR